MFVSDNMPAPHFKPHWPEGYGFQISGSGPSYVISVDKGSVAYKSGISAGDQLVEVDGHNVSEMSADAIRSLTRHRRHTDQPPTLGLVSRVQYKEVIANRRWGYGFTPLGVRPTVVTAVDPPGPAYKAGIREGDIILEVNGKELESLKPLDSILQTKYGKLRLAVLPGNTQQNHDRPSESHVRSTKQDADTRIDGRHSGKTAKVQELFLKLNHLLGSDYQRKMTVVGLIKQYSEDRNIEGLAEGVDRVLVSEEQRLLLKEIRCFVPLKHRTTFDHIVHADKLKSLSINTASPSARTVSQSRTHSAGLGTGLLAIAKHGDRLRSVHVKRWRGGFGFVLRGHHPVCVESVVAQGPADRAGLCSGDQITAVNGMDVSKCSHSELVEILQSSGDKPLLEVRQPTVNPATSTTPRRRHPSHPLYASDSAFSHNSHKTGSSWVNGSGLTLDGHTFRQKVELLMTVKEKMSLRLALIEYNINRNIAQLVDDVKTILDTPAKEVLWLFILHRMSEEHRGYISKYVHLPARYGKDVSSDGTLRSERSHTVPKKSAYTTDFLGSGQISSSTLEHQQNQPMKQTKSLKQQPMKMRESFEQPMKTSESFKQQLDYLLTSRERSQLQQALHTYLMRKNLDGFIKDIGDILDTASKQTLWFHLILQLDPNHRTQAEHVLGLPRIHHHDNNATNVKINKDQKHQPGVFPKYGDILHLQKEFVGNFLTSRKQRQTDLVSSDEDLDDLGPLHSDSSTADHTLNIHTPSTLSSDTLFSPRKTRVYHQPPVQGQFRSRPVYINEKNYSSDVEQATMVLNPIYAEIDHSRDSSLSSQPKPKVRMVREAAAQTAGPLPLTTELKYLPNPTNTPHNPVDFRTIVRVYEGQQKTPDIVTVLDARNANNNSSDALDDEQLVSPVGLHCTNIDDYEMPVTNFANLNSDDRLSQYEHRNDQGRINNIYENDKEKLASQVKVSMDRISARHSALSHANSNEDHVASESSHSLDSSYQSRALDALKALDDVVANERLSSLENDDEDDIEDIEGLFDRGDALDECFIPRPPPPPPPSAPQATVSEAGPYKSSLKLNVKRINWEKINNPSDNTVWAKIEQDADDLEEMVRYLELEQQFSTKQTRVSDCFRDRRTEQYILSPKKAYNVSILLGHLKKDVSRLQEALLTMNEDILTAELLHQLLQYMPDNQELAGYAVYTGSVEELSQPDQFMYLLTQVPGYEDRLTAMRFKLDFTDKVREITKSLQVVKQASTELQQSSELSRVLEVALAMGNYMNQGSSRVGQAAGFRLAFLQRVDLTKTSDGKGSFLSVLAKAVWNRYPEAIAFSLRLPSLHEAVKVSLSAVQADLIHMKTGIQGVSDIIFGLSEEEYDATDRFQEVMERFVTQATDEMQALYSLQKATVEELHQLLTYFGEDINTTDPSLVFQIMADFSVKFERARQKLLLETK